MKGTMLIISPSGSVKTSPLNKVPDLEEIQETIGGWLEQVPQLLTIDYHGTVRACVAFCNEEGKLKGMETNHAATRLWTIARARQGVPPIADVLAGKVVVIFGDRELMSEL